MAGARTHLDVARFDRSVGRVLGEGLPCRGSMLRQVWAVIRPVERWWPRRKRDSVTVGDDV